MAEQVQTNVVDLLIVDEDLAFGPDGEPLLVSGAAAIAQDVQHRVVESGVASLLIADDQSPGLQALAQVVEQDTRIRPGTVELSEPDASGRFKITAKLMDGQNLAAEV